MAIPAYRFAIACTVVLLATMFTSPFAHAQMSGGGDIPKATSGLGEAIPDAVDLANDPAWQVYEFERDGIRYLQINDATNGTRVAIGQIGATVWVLPIGHDADRVLIRNDAQAPVTGRIVYRDDTVEIVYYRQSNQDRWAIRPIDSSQ